MTKIGSFVFFGFPPAGSGVSPKSRMVRYFSSRSGISAPGHVKNRVTLSCADSEGSRPRICGVAPEILRRLRGFSMTWSLCRGSLRAKSYDTSMRAIVFDRPGDESVLHPGEVD